MAPLWVLNDLQTKISYQFADLLLLEKTLVPGDSNSNDREGHRGMAQLGNSLLETLILDDGLERGLSRVEQQNASSNVRNKKFCCGIAKALRLHEWIKPSERQIHVGIQPTTLKNAVSALVCAVWLDSHDLKVVLRVVKSIRLLNHAQNYDELQDTLLMDVSSTESFGNTEISCNKIGFGENDRVKGDYWSLLPEKDRNFDNLFQEQLISAPPLIAELDLTVASISPEGSPDHLPPLSPENQGHQAQLMADVFKTWNKASKTPDRRTRTAQQGFNQDRLSETYHRGDAKVTNRTGRGGKVKSMGRPRATSPAYIIETYVSHEREKENTSQGRESIAHAMNAYQTAISHAPETFQPSLAIIATSIGDSSALLLLKQAIQGLRSPHVDDCFCIDRHMSVPERVRIIKKVGTFTALLRVVRLLHIVTLWEDLSRKAQDGSSGFIIATPDSVAQHTTRKGNPLNLARTEVAQGLCDFRSSQDERSQCDEVPGLPRLRRLGQRLGLIVRKWGPGALFSLGQNLSENKILVPSDQSFEDLIVLIDRLEGTRISAIGVAAFPILRDFCQGNQRGARLQLESVSDDAILKLSRLSAGFEILLAPLDSG